MSLLPLLFLPSDSGVSPELFEPWLPKQETADASSGAAGTACDLVRSAVFGRAVTAATATGGSNTCTHTLRNTGHSVRVCGRILRAT